MKSLHTVLCFLLLAAGSTLAQPARAEGKAPTKTECLDSYEHAQASQKDGKLKSAKADFETCANAACPKLVRVECEAQLPKIAAAFASVKVSVLDAGKAASGGSVTLDGAAFELAAGAVELEPGTHVFKAELSDGRNVERRIELKEGQRDTEVVLDVPAKAGLDTSAQSEPEAAPTNKNAVKPAVWVLGGVAVVGLIGFVGFGLSGKGKQSDLDACKPDCSKGDVDSMRQSYLFADVSLGVALVAGGVGAYLYVQGKKKGQEQAIWVRTLPQRRGMGASVGASF
ncbi:MAG: hypothetical protein IPI67_18125 [Myxococcales bacterium]|nr:hypothetical protein [Myxococcales bacterium]